MNIVAYEKLSGLHQILWLGVIHASTHSFMKHFSVTRWHEWQSHSEHFLLGTVIISRFLGTY